MEMTVTGNNKFESTGDSMPQRLLKPILAFLLPSDPPHWAVTLVVSLIGGFFSWYTGLPHMTQIFGFAMLADFLSGVDAAERRGLWEWRKGIKGIMSKCVIGALNLILLKISYLAGGGMTIYDMLTLALCVNEGKSVLDNLRKRGYEVDTMFYVVLSRFKLPSEPRPGSAPSNADQKKEG